MENEKDKTTQEQTNEQPKPTDDVQLDIETVVPSAHKEEVDPSKPVDQPEKKDSEQAAAKEEPSTESNSQDETGSESKAPESEGKEVTEGEKETDEESDSPEKEEEESNDEGKPDDLRDGIETVSP